MLNLQNNSTEYLAQLFLTFGGPTVQISTQILAIILQDLCTCSWYVQNIQRHTAEDSTLFKK